MIPNAAEKFSHLVSTLTETPTEPLLFAAFLKNYPNDWKQLKIMFSKFNRSKQAKKSIPLPKPEQSLRKMIRVWLQQQHTL